MAETIRDREQAEGYIALVCFKHGPPRRFGVELEWTVHHASNHARPLEAAALWRALGAWAPDAVVPDSPQQCLPAGSRLTVEPGGQLEISTLPHSSLAGLVSAARADAVCLRAALAAHGFALGDRGADPLRPPRRLLSSARYDALEATFDRVGPLGRQMMTSTASVQVCVDAGEPSQLVDRWTAVHAVGPALVAIFANSPCLAGADTGWASSRLRAVLGMSPRSTTPPADTVDPVGHWTRLALEAPLAVLRRPCESWTPPAGMTFADWVAAGSGPSWAAPTYDDLDYHLSTLFPVVRPRGYLEVRYLDQQSGDGWRAPLALLTALLSTPRTVEQAIAAAQPALGRWTSAARAGLTDPRVAAAAAAVVEVGLSALDQLDLTPSDRADVIDRLAPVADRPLAGRKN